MSKQSEIAIRNLTAELESLKLELECKEIVIGGLRMQLYGEPRDPLEGVLVDEPAETLMEKLREGTDQYYCKHSYETNLMTTNSICVYCGLQA